MRGKVAVVLVMMSFIFSVSGSVWAGSFGNDAPKGWGTAAAPQAAAQSEQPASGPKVVPYSASFNLSESASSSGACPNGYANQCAVASCECIEFTGSGHGTTFGTSTSLLFELTLDLNNQPGDPNGTCFPSFGELFIAGTKENESVDVVGATCMNFSGLDTFSGGFELATPSSGAIFDAEGQSATGKFTGATTFVLKLVGKACDGTSTCP